MGIDCCKKKERNATTEQELKKIVATKDKGNKNEENKANNKIDIVHAKNEPLKKKSTGMDKKESLNLKGNYNSINQHSLIT